VLPSDEVSDLPRDRRTALTAKIGAAQPDRECLVVDELRVANRAAR